jgi:CBS domain-containing protein
MPAGVPGISVVSRSGQELVVDDASDKVSDVIQLIREKAVRRVLVTDDGRVVGIVSLGDLARSRDPESALADVSAAPANT